MIKLEDIMLDGSPEAESGRKMPPLTEEEQEILNHVGVMGMKWGHHNAKKAAIEPTKKSSGVDEVSRENQFKQEYANRDKMSTRQLQNRVKRLQAEQQFKDLVEKPGKERAKTEAANRVKKLNRRKMLARGALAMYGAMPLSSMMKGKSPETIEAVKNSQEAARAISNSDFIKPSKVEQSGISKKDVILHGNTKIIQHYGIPGMHWSEKRAITKAGGGKEIKLIKGQIKAGKLELKASKQNLYNAKVNYKNYKNKLNKRYLKSAKIMLKASKMNAKNTKDAARLKSKALIKEYLNNQAVGVPTVQHSSTLVERSKMKIQPNNVLIHHNLFHDDVPLPPAAPQPGDKQALLPPTQVPKARKPLPTDLPMKKNPINAAQAKVGDKKVDKKKMGSSLTAKYLSKAREAATKKAVS